MTTNTKDKILDFIKQRERATPKEIIEHVGLTASAVFRHLAKLQERGLLKKYGQPPKVFYEAVAPVLAQPAYTFTPELERLLETRFQKMTPAGKLEKGPEAFVAWCRARRLDPIKTATEYAASLHKFDAYKHGGLIDATHKFRKTFAEPHLDHLYYLDFYSLERFGKTALGELVLYAKQSQSKALTRLLVDEVREPILGIIKRLNIDAVGFIPPTVKREVQLMKALQEQLRIPVPIIKITKIKTPIIIPQKTLTKLEERVDNAHRSLLVEEPRRYKNILLIDDAVGSGATMHEAARQIRRKDICSGALIGLGLVGSFSGFEVIQEI